MRIILYKSKHGGTYKIGKILQELLDDCLLIDIREIDDTTLKHADTIIVGTPVYYRKLDEDVVRFYQTYRDVLKEKVDALYVVGIFQSEFMSFVTQTFDYDMLKDIDIIVGVGGILYYPHLSITEKMILQVMNKRTPVITKHKDIFENVNREEIELFVEKIKRIEHKKRQ